MEGVFGAEQAIATDWNPLNDHPSVRPTCCAAFNALYVVPLAAHQGVQLGRGSSVASCHTSLHHSRPCLGMLWKAHRHSKQLADCLSLRQVLQGGEGDLATANGSSLAWGNFAKASLELTINRPVSVSDQQA